MRDFSDTGQHELDVPNLIAFEHNQMQDFFSPFIQPFTPHGSPALNFINQDFSKLESPMLMPLESPMAIPEIDLLSPPPSFQMMPYGYVPPLNLNDNSYQHQSRSHQQLMQKSDIPITPSQLLKMNNNDKKVPFKSHREAEQKRRDLLKNEFKELKLVLPKSKSKLNPSKVCLLRKSRSHIQELKYKLKDEENYTQKLLNYIQDLGLKDMPPIPTKQVTAIPADEQDDSDY